MELDIPVYFVTVAEKEFLELLETVDYKRHAYCGGEVYEAIGFGTPYHQRFSDGRLELRIRRREVAIHTTHGEFYIDPTFLKPATR